MRITDFLKSFNLLFLVAFVNEYRDAICGIESQALFDLRDYEDFHLFATRYGLKKAKECQVLGRLWWGGSNFDEPEYLEDDEKTLLNWIDCVCEDHYILENKHCFEKYLRLEEWEASLA